MLNRTSGAGAASGILIAIGIAGTGVCSVLWLDAESSRAAVSTPRFSLAVGAGSCAASGCHGGPREQGVKGSEYSVWATFDKHASAYSVLFDERSKKMEAIYSHLPGTKDAHPEKNALCLKCHALETAASQPEYQSDGVSCEACHGAARDWLNQHYLPGWKGRSPEAKAALGFIDTNNLLARGKACAACHVGDLSKEVNHDLLAAGHPRLAFEYSAFLTLEVKHWDEAAEKQRLPDLEIRTWAIGQVISAQSALELLAERASDRKRPWPEFAEYDCCACHHDLRSKSWRSAYGFPGREPGTPEWGGWFTTLLPKALAAGHLDARSIESELGAVHQKMRFAQDRRAVAEAARRAARALDGTARALGADNGDNLALNSLLDALLHPHDNRTELTWDRATQMYLGLAAAVNARNDRDATRKNPQLLGQVRSIARLLQFPDGKGASDRFDSPKDFDPELVRQAFRNVDVGTSN
jgi:hypothetical protein